MDDTLELFSGPATMGAYGSLKVAARLTTPPPPLFGGSHLQFRREPEVADDEIELIDLDDDAAALFGHGLPGRVAASPTPVWALARREHGRLMLPRSRIEPVDRNQQLIHREHHDSTIFTRAQFVHDEMRSRDPTLAAASAFSWAALGLRGRAPEAESSASGERSPSPPPPAGSVLTNPWRPDFSSALMAKVTPAFGVGAAASAAAASAAAAFALPGASFARLATTGASSNPELAGVDAELLRMRIRSEAPSSPEPGVGDADTHASASASASASRSSSSSTRSAGRAAAAAAAAAASALEAGHSGLQVTNEYGTFAIEPDIFVWERTRGFAVYRPDGSHAALEDGMRHARCHYCVNGPKLSQKRSKWLVKCRRVGCTAWLCQTHYTPAMAVGLAGLEPDGDVFEALIRFEHTPLLCLVDCGLCCCSARNTACRDTTQKQCATFGGATHKCEKMRHRVYNKTKRRKAHASDDSGDSGEEPEHQYPVQRSRKRAMPAEFDGDSTSDVEPEHKRRRPM